MFYFFQDSRFEDILQRLGLQKRGTGEKISFWLFECQHSLKVPSYLTKAHRLENASFCYSLVKLETFS